MTIAHKDAVVRAKVIAASVLDLLTSPDLLNAAKMQFEQNTKDTKYFSLLPPGAKPPVDLNEEMMDKYRPAMGSFISIRKRSLSRSIGATLLVREGLPAKSALLIKF